MGGDLEAGRPFFLLARQTAPVHLPARGSYQMKPTGKNNDSTAGGPDKARALSLDSYSFNFTVSTGERLRAYGGPPAYVLRLRAMEDAQLRYFADLSGRYEALWLAAAAGNIDAEGREVRQSLLDDQGRDRIGELQHARSLFRERRDPELDRCDAFNRAWLRHLEKDYSGLDDLAERMTVFNEVFPVEANLPVDPKTGAYLWMGTDWKPLEPPSREQLLERFPFRQPV